MALSVVLSEDLNVVTDELGRLALFLPEHIGLWAGGVGFSHLDPSRLPARLRFFDDFRQFEQEVELLRARTTR